MEDLGVGRNRFPTAISYLPGRKLLFRIKVTAYNLKYRCEDYTVTDLSSVDDTLDSELWWPPSEKVIMCCFLWCS